MGSGWFGSWGVNTSGFRPGTASESGIVAGHVQGSGLSRDAGRGLCKNNGIYFLLFFLGVSDWVGTGQWGCRGREIKATDETKTV